MPNSSGEGLVYNLLLQQTGIAGLQISDIIDDQAIRSAFAAQFEEEQRGRKREEESSYLNTHARTSVRQQVWEERILSKLLGASRLHM